MPSVSSARRYRENTPGFLDVKGVTVPAAVGVLPWELYQPPRNWTECAYPEFGYVREAEKGDHVAARQEPELLISEVRGAFSPLR